MASSRCSCSDATVPRFSIQTNCFLQRRVAGLIGSTHRTCIDPHRVSIYLRRAQSLNCPYDIVRYRTISYDIYRTISYDIYRTISDDCRTISYDSLTTVVRYRMTLKKCIVRYLSSDIVRYRTTVVGLSYNCRTTVVRQSYDSRAISYDIVRQSYDIVRYLSYDKYRTSEYDIVRQSYDCRTISYDCRTINIVRYRTINIGRVNRPLGFEGGHASTRKDNDRNEAKPDISPVD